MPEGKTPNSLISKVMTMVLVCFFLSGLTGLIYEILWIRMIVKIIGGAPFAVSIILTVFMGGLGLGSYIAGRIIDRIKEPMKLVKIYGILELIIGAYGLAIPVLWTVVNRGAKNPLNDPDVYLSSNIDEACGIIELSLMPTPCP